MRSARLEGATVLVTGVTSGFGRAVAEALVDAGALVVGVGPSPDRPGPAFVPCDVPDSPRAAQDLLRRHPPDVVVLCPPETAPGWITGAGCPVVTVTREPVALPAGVRHVAVLVRADAAQGLQTALRHLDRRRTSVPGICFPEILGPLLADVNVGTQVTRLIGEAQGSGWSRSAAGYEVTGSGLVRLTD